MTFRPTDRTALCALLSALAIAVALPNPARAQFPPEKFTNLKVLPVGISADSLVGLMAGFTRALGVRCTHCHVGEESQPLETYDFAADDKLAKRKARVMLGMVSRINDVELASLEERATPAMRVQCITCHRGSREPRMLQDVLLEAYRTGGIAELQATYATLHERYYGRFVYDFGEVPLSDVAAELADRGNAADAERAYEMNVTANPSSAFAQRQLATFALNRAFAVGEEAGRARYRSLREQSGGAPLAESVLNGVGYRLLNQNRPAVAVAVFSLNVEAYPRSANTHDSLGEGYAANGQTALAIRSYERSLELDPSNTNAAAKLRELRGR